MKEYFCGWYFKCQSERESIALIPAVHRVGGREECSVQLISSGESLNIPLYGEPWEIHRDKPWVRFGKNVFSPRGIRLDLQTASASVSGRLCFGSPTPLRYDIMGPFCAVPFMECRHRVFSMGHAVDGTLWVNGKTYRFQNGRGYIEGDRGRSFPRRYAWTQCNFPGGSLMLATADIPLSGLCFTGVTGAVLLRGREYRLATYLGARAARTEGGRVTVRQGDLTLTAELLEDAARPLKAPVGGAMARTVRENIRCRARYRLYSGDRALLDLDTDRASFEYEY